MATPTERLHGLRGHGALALDDPAFFARLERDAEWLAGRLERLAADMRESLQTRALTAAAGEARQEHSGGRSAGLCGLAGFGLLVVGAALVLAVIVVHQGLALPLSELPARPGLWPGLLMTASGLVLVHTSRQGRQASRESGLPAQAAASVNGHVDGDRSMV